jgi:hypothetical protein
VMLEPDFHGKLLPTHSDIMAILRNVRDTYDIPEIGPQDDALQILVRHHLEIDWKSVHAEILKRLKDLPSLPPRRGAASGAKRARHAVLESMRIIPVVFSVLIESTGSLCGGRGQVLGRSEYAR